ncbi:hypothetical protein IWW48_002007 [Coemansia sp. RSA 1200]|nr:hypothetical protein IWW48_002007 [Coemansia sp. RSA 1200]
MDAAETETAAAPKAAAAADNDPLHQMVAVLGKKNTTSANTTAELYSLYQHSPDIRATLRLVDPAFMDILTTSVAATAEDSNVGVGTRVVRLLTSQVLQGNDSAAEAEAAAEMLSDILNNECGGYANAAAEPTMGVVELCALRASVVQTVVHRIRDGAPTNSGSFARLLCAIEHAATSTTSAAAAAQDGRLCSTCLLVSEVADALVEFDVAKLVSEKSAIGNNASAAVAFDKMSQLLRLLTFAIEQYGDHAIRVLSGHPSLRTLARCIIKMLSVPVPLVAAPALYALTLLVLYPNDGNRSSTQHQISCLPVSSSSSSLQSLSQNLMAKLFDVDHIERTLTLVVDFCLNCQEPSGMGCQEKQYQQYRGSLDDTPGEAEPNHGGTIVNGAVANDLLVLDAVAGIIGAIVRSDNTLVAAGTTKDLFYQSTSIISAIAHLQHLSTYDHRYLTPLLSIVGSIVSVSATTTTTTTVNSGNNGGGISRSSPLLQALFARVGGSGGGDPVLESASSSSLSLSRNNDGDDSIVEEITEFVTLCVEDSVDVMLPFPITIGGRVLGLECKEEKNSRHHQQKQPTWWLYTSFEEGSYGWLFNSNRNDRQRIGSSLACLLRSLGKHETQPDAVYRILDTVVRPYLTTSVAGGTHINGAAGLDVVNFELNGDALENRRLAQYLTYVGCHYWIVRPVLLLAVDLAHGISKGTEAARSVLASHPQHDKELQGLFAWAERTVCSKQSVDICSSAALFFGTNKPNDHDEDGGDDDEDDDEDGFSQATHLSPGPYRGERGGAAAAATPDSAFSSPSASLKHRKNARDTIGIAELRRANNNNSNGQLENGTESKQGVGLGITTTAEQQVPGHKRRRERWQEAQTFLLDHWKRICEADLAQLLVRLSTALMHSEGEKKEQDEDQYQRREPDVVNNKDNDGASSRHRRPPNAHDWALALVDLHSRHMSARETVEIALQKELHNKQKELAEADDRAAALLDELQRVQNHSSELSRAIERHQAIHGEMEQESKRMRTSLDDLRGAHRQAQADAAEWKDECTATRDLLDRSEGEGKKTRELWEQLTETHGRLEREYEREQDMWKTRSVEMARSNKELELALANAVTRLRDLEAQADLDRSVSDELRRQNGAMAVRLAEFAKLSETLHTLSRIHPQ